MPIKGPPDYSDDQEDIKQQSDALVIAWRELGRALALLRRVSDEGKDMPSGVMIPGDLYWAIENLLEEGGDELAGP